jgi:hypothetical protein
LSECEANNEVQDWLFGPCNDGDVGPFASCPIFAGSAESRTGTLERGRSDGRGRPRSNKGVCQGELSCEQINLGGSGWQLDFQEVWCGGGDECAVVGVSWLGLGGLVGAERNWW